jgi:HAD superfamily hydrolase (TIGR01509 family)
MFRRILYTIVTCVALFSWQSTDAKRHSRKQSLRSQLQNQNQPTINVIFDLGGVLVDTSHASAFWATGPLKFLMYIARFNNPSEIRSLMFNYLNTIKPQHSNDASTARDEHGSPLPQIMCDWLDGSKTNVEIRKAVCQSINTDTTFFKNNAQRQLVRAMTCTIFTPETMVKTQRLLKDGVAFVKSCKKKGYKLYVLSNWEPESFHLLKTEYADLFDLFDGTVISGEAGYNKPDMRIYQHILKKYDLDPATCIFFDDQPCNIAGAEAAGIFGVVCPRQNSWWHKGPDFKSVQATFDAWLKVRTYAQAA